MDILEFEKRIKAVLRKDEDGLYDEELELFLHKDGCLGCKFKGESIPCEGLPWDDALARIIEYVEAQG